MDILTQALPVHTPSIERHTAAAWGRCGCGCGGVTSIAKRNRPYLGHVMGQPTPFMAGHSLRKPAIDPGDLWVVQDCGYVTPCRLWQRYCNKDGYGTTKVRTQDGRRRTRSVHIVEWEAVNGPVPEGLELDHLCRQRSCGEPTHLDPVPQRVNLRRGLVAKLVPEQVIAIRQSTLRTDQLAEEYGVTVHTIRAIRRGDRWADIGGPIRRRPKGKPRGRSVALARQREAEAA